LYDEGTLDTNWKTALEYIPVERGKLEREMKRKRWKNQQTISPE
jgi:hypothetical protein